MKAGKLHGRGEVKAIAASGWIREKIMPHWVADRFFKKLLRFRILKKDGIAISVGCHYLLW